MDNLIISLTDEFRVLLLYDTLLKRLRLQSSIQMQNRVVGAMEGAYETRLPVNKKPVGKKYVSF
jgi:hypothetical protein